MRFFSSITSTLVLSITLATTLAISTSNLSAQTHAADTTNRFFENEKLILPQSLDANLQDLMRSWNKGYASDKIRTSKECGNKRNTPRAQIQSDSAIISRIAKLPTTIPITFNPIVRKSILTFLNEKSKLISTMLSLGDYYFPTMEQILDKHRVPTELMYLTIIESALNPRSVSPAGASGLWQFMLPTAKIYGLEINSYIDERLDVVKSTEAAARYFKDMHAMYKDWLLVIAAYNCGPGNVNKAIRKAGGKMNFWSIYRYLPRETRNYIPLFIGAYYAMHYHSDYNICPIDNSLPLATDTVLVRKNLSFDAVAKVTKVSSEQVQILNPQYRRRIVPGHIKPYPLRLPLWAMESFDRGVEQVEPTPRETTQAEGGAEQVDWDGLQATNSSQRNGGKKKSKSSSYKTYTVRKGDTLSRIASRHGVSVAQIKRHNNLKKSSSKLMPGQKIKIPAR